MGERNKQRGSDAERMEERRLALQAALDAQKDAGERNKLGQFATPTALARDILSFGRQLLGTRKTIHFLDPAVGTGSFFSALGAVAPPSRIGRCLGFDIDPHYAEPARELWRGSPLEIRLADFTTARPPGKAGQANLLVCNPPYVRHHHLEGERKRALQALVHERLGIRPSGLAGLYCYFLWLSHAWLSRGGVAGWLLPSEWMDVNYGHLVKDYLLSRVQLVRIHCFEPSDVQFGDALVSSAIVWFRNQAPGDEPVTFSLGGSLAAPQRRIDVPRGVLAATPKWTRIVSSGRSGVPSFRSVWSSASRSHAHARPSCLVPHADVGPRLGDLFAIKRGVATGANAFFVLSPEQVAQHHIPRQFLRPILPGPRYLETNDITADSDGSPAIERRRFLLVVDQPEHVVEREHPALWVYLQEGVAAGIPGRYLSRHRTPWYAQEQRPPAPILCTYMGRATGHDARPFRFIRNRSHATAANVYLLLYPRAPLARASSTEPDLLDAIWSGLDRLPGSALVSEGRVYGGGLHKLEPRELANLPLVMLGVSLPDGAIDRPHRNLDLFTGRTP